MSEARSERLSLAAILAKVSQARRVIESEQVSLPGTMHHRLDTALDGIEEEARALLGQVATGVHTNPGTLAIYGNPPQVGTGATLGVTLKGALGYVERLEYERTAKPAGPYFHIFGASDALWKGQLANGQKVILIANVNGDPLWGTG